MKILIVTQNVDRTDPVLGFFHQWLEEFSRQVEQIVVVAQGASDYCLPDNVIVESLGKQKGKSPWTQVLRSYGLFWKYRKQYDVVFVHMTPIWILIGAPLWLVLRKPMYLWYEIKRGNWKLSTALLLVKKVFAATPHGLPRASRKLIVVGHGIDTNIFTEGTHEDNNLVVAIGRITQIKHYEVILRTFAQLPHTMRLRVAGGPITAADIEEEKHIHHLAQSLGISDRIEISWVAPSDIPMLLQKATLFLHASQGGLDKALLQAMSTGCLTVSVSSAAQSILPDECKATESTMAEVSNVLLQLSETQKKALSAQLRSIVITHHSLTDCIEQMVRKMQ